MLAVSREVGDRLLADVGDRLREIRPDLTEVRGPIIFASGSTRRSDGQQAEGPGSGTMADLQGRTPSFARTLPRRPHGRRTRRVPDFGPRLRARRDSCIHVSRRERVHLMRVVMVFVAAALGAAAAACMGYDRGAQRRSHLLPKAPPRRARVRPAAARRRPTCRAPVEPRGPSWCRERLRRHPRSCRPRRRPHPTPRRRRSTDSKHPVSCEVRGSPSPRWNRFDIRSRMWKEQSAYGCVCETGLCKRR